MQTEHLMNEAWAKIKEEESLETLTRIAQGYITPVDARVIMRVFCFVAGKINIELAEAASLESCENET